MKELDIHKLFEVELGKRKSHKELIGEEVKQLKEAVVELKKILYIELYSRTNDSDKKPALDEKIDIDFLKDSIQSLRSLNDNFEKLLDLSFLQDVDNSRLFIDGVEVISRLNKLISPVIDIESTALLNIGDYKDFVIEYRKNKVTDLEEKILLLTEQIFDIFGCLNEKLKNKYSE